MKRRSVLAVMMFLAISLCGCGSGKGNDKKDSPPIRESREEQTVENDWSISKRDTDNEENAEENEEKNRRLDRITYTYQCHPVEADHVRDMIVTGITTGSWIGVSGVDFGSEEARVVELKVQRMAGLERDKIRGKAYVCIDSPEAKALEEVEISMGERKGVIEDEGFVTFSSRLDTKVSGVHDVYFVFEGEGYELYSWKFIR